MSEAPLYATEEQIAERVLGHGKLREWRAIAQMLERKGLPQIDPVTGCRYFPAVKAFLDRRHGLTDAPVPLTPDGSETWPEPKKRRASDTGREPASNIQSIGSRDRT